MFLSLLLGCPHPVAVDNEAQPDSLSDNQVVLLHTNDLHGHFLPETAKWLDGEPKIGGFEAIDSWVRFLEGLHGEDRVLLLDGGDLLTGTPLTDLTVRGFQGGAMLEFLEAVGYDAWVVGNHEFDKGFDNAEAMVFSSNIPALSANLRSQDGGMAMRGLKPSVTFDAGPLRVGVIGTTTMGLTHLASAKTMQHINLMAPAEVIQVEIDRLDPVTDLLVVLSHMGLDADRRLAGELEGLDVIVGGHSHTPMKAPEVVNGVHIVQAGSYGRSLGVSKISVEEDRVKTFEWRLEDLEPQRVPGEPSARVSELVLHYQGMLEAEFGRVVGEAIDPLERNYSGTSSLGNWITDVLRESTDADIGLYNAGGIRADLPKGPITKGDLFQVFPFSNSVVTFEISGSQLLGILLGNARVAVDGGHGFMQLSGAEMTWRLRMDVAEMDRILIGEKPFDPDSTYKVATNTYVLEQAAKYLPGAVPENVQSVGKTVFEAALEAAGSGPIVADTAHRMRRIE